jgi:glycosyltransferase involved in cell wall biosynthesis
MAFDLLCRLLSRPAPPERVRRIVEGRVDLRDAFPLAYTPWGRPNFLAWLLEHGRGEYGIPEAEARAFVAALARDDGAAVAEAYRWQPGWQEAVPDALTVAGWPKLLAHLHRTYGVTGAVRPPRFEPPAGRGVNVLGYYRFPCGLQEVARQYGRAAERAGFRVARRDVPTSYDPANQLAAPGQRFDALEVYDTSLVVIGAAEPLAKTYRLAGLHPRPGVRRIACWAWELAQFPAEAVAGAGLVDAVWTLTEFSANAVRAAWPGKRVTAMLPAVEVAAAPPLSAENAALVAGKFVVLFAFDMGSCGERKNPLGLIRAFRAALPAGEPATLVVKVSRASANPPLWAAMRAAAAADPRVILLDAVMPRGELDAWVAACDCYASLHRAEGLGLTMAEAMLRGKPVVATGYSGNLDFMTPETAHFVRYKLAKVGPGNPPYDAAAEWAEPDEAHAAELLRQVADDRDAAAALGRRARAHAEAVFSIEAAAKRVAQSLGERGT